MTTPRQRPDALLVDDDPQVLLALAMLLEVMGWNTSKTDDSEQALLRVRERDFDLAIIDLRMPAINGLELCRQIRNLDKKKPPLLFLHSGYIDPRLRAEVERSGVQAVLNKPIGLKEIQTIFKKFNLPCKA